MTTLTQFYAQVSDEIRRGSKLNYQVPTKVQMAISWMEKKYTFKYMERFCTLLIDSTVSQPRAIQQPTGFKQMYFWRIINDNGTYSRITQVDAYDQSANNYNEDVLSLQTCKSAKPEAYWQDGNNYFWLDNTPNVNYNSELAFTNFTILPADTSQSPTIIQTYADLILWQTMLLMASTMREPNITTLYKPLRDEAMEAAVNSDIEQRQSGRSESMKYGWEYMEDVNNVKHRPFNV